MAKYFVSKNDAKKRLDIFLAIKFPNFTRSKIQKVMKGGDILVNSGIVKPSYKLKIGDEVKINFKKEKVILKPNPNIKLNIVYENGDFIVLNKPAGILVHPTSANENNTLVNGLLAYYPRIKNVGENIMRPGIVHRLDRDTSGLMVVAKNNETFDWLKNQFKNKLIQKKYYALVYGKLKNKMGTIISQIGKYKGKQITGKGIKKLKIKARVALTEYKVIKTYRNYSLLEVQPKTGRTHQIRVHLASIGHPVVGDKLYKFKRLKPPAELKRQFLHAYHLKFCQMPGKRVFEFKICLPEDLKKVISSLENKNNA